MSWNSTATSVSQRKPPAIISLLFFLFLFVSFFFEKAED
jgi:hypothetical protein